VADSRPSQIMEEHALAPGIGASSCPTAADGLQPLATICEDVLGVSWQAPKGVDHGFIEWDGSRFAVLRLASFQAHYGVVEAVHQPQISNLNKNQTGTMKRNASRLRSS